jgi:hypothetical protein
MAGFSSPGEAGLVYGLDNSVRAAARSIAPLIGSFVALWFGLRGAFIATGMIFILTWVWFGLRGAFIATGMIFILTWVLAAIRLPEPTALVETPIQEPSPRHW